MSEAFTGQIMPVAFGFAPSGWAHCNGVALPINQNQALFTLLGTTYGGNGTTNFHLPDLRGNTPLGQGERYKVGQAGGAEVVALQESQLPPHMHLAGYTAKPGEGRNPGAALFGDTGKAAPIYADEGGPQVALNAATVASAGVGEPHPNMQPYLVLNFCIALTGPFPTH